MMGGRGIVLVLALFAAACATRPADDITVHVFSNQPDDPSVAAVADQLEAAGYSHRITYAETPGGLEVAETVIVHGDSAGAFNRAQDLAELIAPPDRSIPIERERYGNHYFTAGNLAVYIFLPGEEPVVEPAVHAHFAGDCEARPIELFLLVDRSYRLERQRWEDDYTLVDTGGEDGDWRPDGSGYRLTTANGRDWFLEPPLDADPAVQVYFIQQHPDFDGCRVAAPL